MILMFVVRLNRLKRNTAAKMFTGENFQPKAAIRLPYRRCTFNENGKEADWGRGEREDTNGR